MLPGFYGHSPSSRFSANTTLFSPLSRKGSSASVNRDPSVGALLSLSLAVFISAVLKKLHQNRLRIFIVQTCRKSTASFCVVTFALFCTFHTPGGLVVLHFAKAIEQWFPKRC